MPALVAGVSNSAEWKDGLKMAPERVAVCLMGLSVTGVSFGGKGIKRIMPIQRGRRVGDTLDLTKWINDGMSRWIGRGKASLLMRY